MVHLPSLMGPLAESVKPETQVHLYELAPVSVHAAPLAHGA